MAVTPVASYRLHLHAGFGFAQAAELMPYLAGLGISHAYLSPITRAVFGSLHGYDVLDPTVLSPELGSPADFDRLAGAAAAAGLALLIDVVPNHMAMVPDNPWWLDVLEHGRASPFASVFDIRWETLSDDLHGRLLLPILTRPFHRVLESGSIRPRFDASGFHLEVQGRRLPLAPESYAQVLEAGPEPAEPATDPALDEEWRALAAAARVLAGGGGRTAELKERLQRATAGPLQQRLDACLEALAGRRGQPASFDRLERLLAVQHYRLAHWRMGRWELNHRRFFNIAELICVRPEDPAVFELTHRLWLELWRSGRIGGLRIDHLDGLRDPGGYLVRLRRRLRVAGRGDAWVIVEKILTGGERLPKHWAADGTTGYEFAGAVDRLLVDGPGLAELGRIYAGFIGRQTSFADTVYEQKKRVLRELFPVELERLRRAMLRLSRLDRQACDLAPPGLARALAEVTVSLPVYRTYIRRAPLAAHDRRYLEAALAEARRRNPGLGAAELAFIERLLTLRIPPALRAAGRRRWREFVADWQQFTGPLMAKGMEDTAFYVYNRLLSLNEVGGQPDPPPHRLGPGGFHRFCRRRRRANPAGLNAGSTHDTKRSEDVRARLDVLTELPDEWGEHLARWSRMNARLKPAVRGMPVPEPNTEYALYQTLLGVWPHGGPDLDELSERLNTVVIKAAHEAKVHSSWRRPDPDYDGALVEFVRRLLGPEGQVEFLPDFADFQARIAFHGALNSLAAGLVRITAPGVPDFYQGTESWDFSLVDPDNRRPVDFDHRRAELARLELDLPPPAPERLAELMRDWRSGRIKTYLIARALSFRRRFRDEFLAADYQALVVRGPRAGQAVGLTRRHGRFWAVALVPRCTIGLVPAGRMPLGEEVWGATWAVLPEGAPGRWRDVLTGIEVRAAGRPGARRRLPLAQAFRHFPVALLEAVFEEVGPES